MTGPVAHDLLPLRWQSGNRYVVLRCTCGLEVAKWRPEREALMARGVAAGQAHLDESADPPAGTLTATDLPREPT